MSRKMAVRNKGSQPEKKFFLERGADKSQYAKAYTSKRSGLIFRIFLGLSILILTMLLIGRFWSTAWPVKGILLTGNAQHVSELAITEILSGENMGGMLSIDLNDLRMRLLNNPWVRTVMIRKRWPETLNFELEEFEAIATVNNKILLVSGALLDSDGIERDDNLLNIAINEQHMNIDFDYLNLVAQVKMMKSKLEEHHLILDRFEIDETNSWFIYLDNRFGINLGRHKQQQKIDRFFTVFAAIENKLQLETIDLRYRNGLSVKYKQKSPNSNDLNNPRES